MVAMAPRRRTAALLAALLHVPSTAPWTFGNAASSWEMMPLLPALAMVVLTDPDEVALGRGVGAVLGLKAALTGKLGLKAALTGKTG
eukprot:13511041-Alexandrium_andersonii.AAC.1